MAIENKIKVAGGESPATLTKEQEKEKKGVVVPKKAVVDAIDKLYDGTVRINTKTVIIRAVPTFIVTPNEVKSEAYCVIHAPLRGRNTYIPLEKSELTEVAEQLFGFSTKDTDFVKTIMEYFAEYRIKVEYGTDKTDGVKLVLPLDKEGKIVFHKDYVDAIIQYRICLQSKRVATTPDEILEATSGQSNFMAFLYDADADKVIERQLSRVKREAEKNFLVYTEENKRKELKWLVRVITKGVSIGNNNIFFPSADIADVDYMNDDDMIMILRELSNKYPGALNKLISDPNLEMRALIELAIDLKSLVRKPDGMIKFRDDVLGGNVSEAIDNLKKPRNSNLMIEIQASIANNTAVI